MGITSERLARYSSEFSYDRLPAKTVHQAKRLLLNTICCCIPGFYGLSSKIIRNTIKEVGGIPECTIIGSSTKTSCENATLINGSSSHYWDARDWYGGPIDQCHPSDNIAVALALAERQDSSGKQLLAAIVLGYEVVCRLIDHAGIFDDGFDSATYAAYSTPAIAGYLLGASTEQIVNAMGVSGCLSNALVQSRSGVLSMLKVPAFHLVARQAIFASLLAQNGFTGPKEIFEGDNGFCRRIAGDFDIPRLGGEEGEDFKVHQTVMKQFSVGFSAQSAVRAAIENVLENDIESDDVEEVRVKLATRAVNFMAGSKVKWEVTNTESAQNSAPYCIAVAIHDRLATPNQFTLEKIMEPSVRNLMQKIKITSDKDIDKLYPQMQQAEVTIKIKGGKEYTKRADYPIGHPMSPASDDQLAYKFRTYTKDLLSESQIEEAISLIMNLEKIDHIRELFPLMEI